MHTLTENVLSNPSDYAHVFALVGAVLLFWAVLCISALLSLRATRRRPTARRWLRFCLAAVPCALASVGLWSSMEFYIETDGVRRAWDLRWLFVVPLLLGSIALGVWWRALRRSRQGEPTGPPNAGSANATPASVT